MLAPRIAGLAAPLVAAALWLAGTWNFVDADEARALENAGKTFNHKVADDSASAQMDRMLAKQQPDVLVLGPSYANTDSDPRILAAQFGIPPSKVLVIAVPNSVGPHWLAILRYRVYANGLHPKLLVMLSGLQSMLLTTPLTEASWLSLLEELPPEGDPQITGRLDRGWNLQLARLQEKRGQVRRSIFNLCRDLPAWLLFPSEDDSSTGMIPTETRDALDRVFADANVDVDLQRLGNPILEADRENRNYTADMLPSPDASFLGDITREARAHGTRVVWVRPPMSPFIQEDLDDVVLPGVQERAAALVADAGGAFIDLRGLPMTMDMYKNEDHMSPEGGRRFSKALARALLDADTGWPPLVPTSVTLDGAPAELSPAMHLEPGQSLELRFDAPWDVLRGRMVAGVVAEGTLAPAVVGFAEKGELPLEAHSDPAVPGRWTVRAAGAAPAEAWGLRLTAASPLTVRSITFGEAGRRALVLGTDADADGAASRLFGVVDLEGGTITDRSARPSYRSPPPAVPGGAKRTVQSGEGLTWFDTEKFALLSDERLIGETNYGSRCSPLRVDEDGRTLPMANVSCRDVRLKGGGRSCHSPERLYFTTVDGSDPAGNGREYKVALDPDRACDGAVWLYPKDAFTVTFPASDLAKFTEPARWLSFGARYLNFRDAHLQVRLEVDGHPVLDRRVDAHGLEDRKHWRLDPPIDVAGHTVTLAVENLDNTFYLVDEATLSERDPALNP